MIEFRVANEEEGVMDYLIAWGEKSNRTFYHLYVDGVKKDDTLYIAHLFDKAYCFGDVEKKDCGLGWVAPNTIQITDGLILIHKVVESHYSESVMRIVRKDGKKHSNKCLDERQVLIHSNGNILFEEEDKNTIDKYYDIISDRIFTTHKSHYSTQYYHIGEDKVDKFFEGYETTKSNNCVYGHPMKEIKSYHSHEHSFMGQDTSIVYCLNKKTLELTLDN